MSGVEARNRHFEHATYRRLGVVQKPSQLCRPHRPECSGKLSRFYCPNLWQKLLSPEASCDLRNTKFDFGRGSVPDPTGGEWLQRSTRLPSWWAARQLPPRERHPCISPPGSVIQPSGRRCLNPQLIFGCIELKYYVFHSCRYTSEKLQCQACDVLCYT